MAEIFEFEFMRTALGIGLIIGALAPLIGTFLVIKRYSLIADTLAHTSLLGAALGYLLKIDPFFGSLATAIFSSISIESLRARNKGSGDTILAMFLSGSLAMAAMVMAIAGKSSEISSYLFGSITTTTWKDFTNVTVMGVIVLILITLNYKALFSVSIDEETAKANGLKVWMVNGLLIISAAVCVSISIRTIGSLLIGALTTIPVLSSMNLAKSFKSSIYLSIFFSELSVVSGLVASYFLNFGSGSLIVLAAIVIYIVSLVLKD